MARIQTRNTKIKTEKRQGQAGRKPSSQSGTPISGPEGSGATGTGKKAGTAKAAGNKGAGSGPSKVRQITDQEILELLLEDVFDEPTDYGAQEIQSLKKAGKESDLAGVAVTMEDGSEYHVLIRKMK